MLKSPWKKVTRNKRPAWRYGSWILQIDDCGEEWLIGADGGTRGSRLLNDDFEETETPASTTLVEVKKRAENYLEADRVVSNYQAIEEIVDLIGQESQRKRGGYFDPPVVDAWDSACENAADTAREHGWPSGGVKEMAVALDGFNYSEAGERLDWSRLEKLRKAAERKDD